MVHKIKSKLTEKQENALQEINELTEKIDDLDDAENALDENNLYSEADETLKKSNELRVEKAKLISKAFGTYKKYSNAQIKYGRKFS